MSDIDSRIAAAVALHREDRLDDAAAAYRAILETAPGHPGVLHNLGVIAAQRGRPEEAVSLFDRALAADPGYVSAHLNKGNALRELARFEDALASYDAALALSPGDGAAQFGAGEALRGMGRLDAAAARYERALAMHPGFYDAHLALALALNALDRRGEALAQFRHTSRIRRDAGYTGVGRWAPRTATKRKMEHDIAQFRYLAARTEQNGRARFAALAQAYEAVLASVHWPDDADEAVSIPDAAIGSVAESVNRPIHNADAPELPECAIDPALDTAAIAARYRGGAPGVVWFDGLLSEKALAALRRYLLESTIWHDFAHIPGFLAAYLEDGLACPLLLQIAAELRWAFPDILGPHALTQAWAFKGLTGDRGIDVHADAGRVSVNFWVTPDDANRDPDAGGLAVYTARPPEGWRLKTYDADVARIRKYLADVGGEAEVIPYRENRAVFFKSDLFHESGAVAFKPGYENHRINITLLFGERGSA